MEEKKVTERTEGFYPPAVMEGPFREPIAKLGKMITDRIPQKLGLKKIERTDPEYWALALMISDEEAEIALKFGGIRIPRTLPEMAKRTGIPGRIVHAHNAQNEASKIKGLFHCINRHRIAAYATEFWSCSDNAAAYFYPESVRTSASFWMVNNAIDLERFAFKEDAREKVREEFALSPDILVVGHVGRFSPQKNHSFLLEIFAKILKKRPDAKLLLVGQGELEEGIREKAKELGVLDDVIFTGARSDVEALLSAMDVFLFPSLFEGLPLALLEAQAEGLPCYTTAHTVPKEADMTGLVHYLELSAPPDAWAESVLSTWKEKSRFGSYDERIRAHGYDIRQEAALLQQKLMEISENNRDNRE